jgi:hypothetical protein
MLGPRWPGQPRPTGRMRFLCQLALLIDDQRSPRPPPVRFFAKKIRSIPAGHAPSSLCCESVRLHHSIYRYMWGRSSRRYRVSSAIGASWLIFCQRTLALAPCCPSRPCCRRPPATRSARMARPSGRIAPSPQKDSLSPVMWTC